ncbi:MAG: hypothetical protein BWK78_00565 [Thiotrichaceae bacterium IS1]|nr:MAG: hypothetical protein BWK78_00565 [Thiotrichaceae bacterium IS1]
MISNRFFRFLVVGGFNTAFSYGLYAFFLLIGLHYLLAGIASFIISLLVNFQTSGRLVFQNTDPRRFLKYVFGYVTTLPIGLFLLDLLVTAGINPYYAGLVNILPMAIIAFVIQRFFVFR